MYTQSCCYERRSWSWSWWWWWWDAFGSLIRQRTYEAGSALKYNPFFYPQLHEQNDDQPKQWCCLMSNNCHLYYNVRPMDTCWGYRLPWFAWNWGDPHVVTLDNLNYTFNGLGEYVLAQSSSFVVQGRTVRAWDDSGQPSPSGTVFGAVAAQGYQLEGNDSTTTPSARIHVQMTPDRETGLIIKEIEVDDVVIDRSSWFIPTNPEPAVLSGVQLSKENDSLNIAFTSGVKVIVTLRGQQLDVSVVVPTEFRGTENITGLLGNFNNDPSDDLISRNGTLVSSDASDKTIHYDFGETWRLGLPTESLFWYNEAAGKTFATYHDPGDYRPIFNFTPTADQINAARNCCNPDGSDFDESGSCAFDFYSTGNCKQSFTSRSIDTENREELETLANNAPFINGPEFQQWIVRESNSVILNITDFDNDTVTMQPADEIPLGANLHPIDETSWEFAWTPENMDPVQLRFTGNDSRGQQASRFTLNVRLCNCSGDHGTCVFDQFQDGYNASSPFALVECDCTPGLYEGAFCELDLDACQTSPCGVGGTCDDISASELSIYPAGYICTNCSAGYELTDNMTKCSDIDECASNATNSCDSSTGTCNNTEGSYICDCFAGFFSDPSRKSCQDFDECDLRLASCRQICDNIPGSYACRCYEGYTLENETVCVEYNTSCNPSCDHYCQNGNCACWPGYILNGATCDDEDECTNGNHSCSANANCTNTEGSYECECHPGFLLLADMRTCTECPSNKWGMNCVNDCRCSALCDRAVGCTSCDESGVEGPNCDIDINECTLGTHNCSAHSQCINQYGTYSCPCDPWYQDVRGSCELINACEKDKDGNPMSSPCSELQICQDGRNPMNPGTFNCVCEAGYTGSNCKDRIHPCTSSPCKNGGTCVRFTDYFQCQCTDSYTGATCETPVNVPTTAEITTSRGDDVDDDEPSSNELLAIILGTVGGALLLIAVAAVIVVCVFRARRTPSPTSHFFNPNLLINSEPEPDYDKADTEDPEKQTTSRMEPHFTPSQEEPPLIILDEPEVRPNLYAQPYTAPTVEEQEQAWSTFRTFREHYVTNQQSFEPPSRSHWEFF